MAQPDWQRSTARNQIATQALSAGAVSVPNDYSETTSQQEAGRVTVVSSVILLDPLGFHTVQLHRYGTTVVKARANQLPKLKGQAKPDAMRTGNADRWGNI